MFVPLDVCTTLSGFHTVGAAAGACRDIVVAAKQLRAWVDAVEAAALARLQELAGPNVSARSALTAEVRELAGVSGHEAKRRLGTASGLATLPVVHEALAAGRITSEHAHAFASAARSSDRAAEAVVGAQAALLEHAFAEPADAFAKRVARFVAGADQAAGEDTARRHRRRRGVARFTDDDGMAIIRSQLPVTDADEVWRVLCHIARRLWRTQHPEAHADNAPSDTMLLTPSATYRQLLADALVEMARLAANGKGTGIAPHVAPIVHIDLQTLVDGLHEHSVCQTGDGTPLPVSELRRLACEAGVIPAVLGSRGEVLDLGFRARYFTPAQKRALDIMWGGCFMPACPVGPDHTHAHHIEPFAPPNGPTDIINSVPGCSAHHHLIHDGTLVVTQPELGHAVITYADGRVVHSHAAHPPPQRAGPTKRMGGQRGTEAAAAERPRSSRSSPPAQAPRRKAA